jgi:predicted dithiol-disulfide oxidoreductase (DUF899 family)
MTTHTVGTREEWLAARNELLEADKEHLRRGDELARRRQELPWVPPEQEYVVETADGRRTQAGGRSAGLALPACALALISSG